MIMLTFNHVVSYPEVMFIALGLVAPEKIVKVILGEDLVLGQSFSGLGGCGGGYINSACCALYVDRSVSIWSSKISPCAWPECPQTSMMNGQKPQGRVRSSNICHSDNRCTRILRVF